MTVYNEDEIFKYELRCENALTPVPEKLTVNWDGGGNYYFDEVYDGHSLVWIYVMTDTYEEAFPGPGWNVDDPGTLYSEENSEEIEESEESPYDMKKMQEAADLALARYESLFNRLKAAGVPVVEAG